MNTLDTSPDLLSVEAVCAALGIKRSGFYARRAKRGPVPTVKIGRRIYFRKEVLASPLALPG